MKKRTVRRVKPAACVARPTKRRKGYKGRWTCISKNTGRVLKVKGWGRKKATRRSR